MIEPTMWIDIIQIANFRGCTTPSLFTMVERYLFRRYGW